MSSADRTSVIQGWIDRLHAGDESAREGLYRSVKHRLELLAKKMLRGYPSVARWEEADDVLQNVFIRLDRALGAAVPPTALDFCKLAATQIRRELIDMARHYGGPHGMGAHHATRAGNGIAAVDDGSPPESTHNPEKLAQWTEFHTAVERLGEEDREVFDLLWYQGLTHAEAASILGVVEKTVQRRWIRARKHLGDWLEGPWLG